MKLDNAMDDPVQLKRDLENPYDQFAIKVICQEKQIGYISAYENIVLANLLDQDVALSASVSEVITKDKNNIENNYLMNVVAIQVFAEWMAPVTHIQLAELTKDRAANALDVYRQGEFIIDEKITINKKK